ncbi:MAG: nitrate- and nitrite sensing domain-containing protein [Limnobacter sp.]|uniref:nitrate- and nitrite sensing domain-containing protein n=1 Tax=Limnobacter sp. TaxID=2003368 RepID=UPI003918E9EB
MPSALHYLRAARQCEMQDLSNLARTSDLIRVASELIHRLQHERGVSNIYLASGGQQHEKDRQARIKATSEALVKFREQLDLSAGQVQFSGGVRLYTRIAMAIHALDGLVRLRDTVDALKCTPQDNTASYQQLVEALLALIFEAADVAVDPDVSRLLVALFNLMQGKEFAGRERATGAAAFTAGQVTEEQIQSMEFLIEMQEQCFQRFVGFAAELHREWTALQASMPLAELGQMRQLLQGPSRHLLDQGLSDTWFDCCSRRMDDLHEVEMHLAGVLQALCKSKMNALEHEADDEPDALSKPLPSDDLSPLSVFNTTGASAPLPKAVVEQLNEQASRVQKLTEELAAVKTSLEERKLIERAKGMLMAHRGLTEEGAYRWLRRSAMDHNRRLADVAKSVLTLADLPPT